LLPLLIFIFFFFHASCGSAQDQASVLSLVQKFFLPNHLEAHFFTLKNGLRVILVPIENVPVVASQIWFKNGAAAEKSDPQISRTGLAHLYEHLLFRGTPGFGAEMKRLGAVDYNAETWLDFTRYFGYFPAAQLESVMRLEAKRFNQLQVTTDLFQNEIGAARIELAQQLESPETKAVLNLWSELRADTDYGAPTIGRDEDLKGFKLEEAQYFFSRYYQPNQATLILVGGFNLEATKALMGEIFANFLSSNVPKDFVSKHLAEKNYSEPRVFSDKSHTFSFKHEGLSAPILYLSYRTPPKDSPDTPVLVLINYILGVGRSSLLSREFVEKGTGTNIDISYNIFRKPGLEFFTVYLKPGADLHKSQQRSSQVLDRLRHRLVPQLELSRAKNLLSSRYAHYIGDPSSIAYELGSASVTSISPLRNYEIWQEAMKVTPRQVFEVAQKYLSSDNVWYAKIEGAERK
jgi:zinc protease